MYKAQMSQSTYADGSKSDWTVSIGEEELFTLDSSYTDKQMFEVRDIIVKMIERAHKQGYDLAYSAITPQVENLKKVHQKQIDALMATNSRLAVKLHEFIGEE